MLPLRSVVAINGSHAACGMSASGARSGNLLAAGSSRPHHRVYAGAASIPSRLIANGVSQPTMNTDPRSPAESLDRFLNHPLTHWMRRIYTFGLRGYRRVQSHLRSPASAIASAGFVRTDTPDGSSRKNDGVSLASFWLASQNPSTLPVDVRMSLLQQARAAGAPDTASAIARALLPDMWSLKASILGRLPPTIIDQLCTVGEHALALQVATEFAASNRPSRTHPAVIRACLTLEPPHEFVLPRGRLNTFLISQLLLSGDLHDTLLIPLLNRARRQLITVPEIELLLASAYRSAVDAPLAKWVVPVNRALRFYGLPPLLVAREAGNPLLGIRGAPASTIPRVHGPLVSVIVSAYNAQHTIVYAIDSILQQSYENLEVLVCDDHSSDGTLDVLRDRYAHHMRVKLFAAEANHGPYNCRNAMLRHVSGRYITFHDADDFAMPTRIASQVCAMSEASSVTASITNWVRIAPSGHFVFFRDLAAVRLCLPSLMVERSLAHSLGEFRWARIAADDEYFYRLQARVGATNVARLRQPLVLGLWSDSSLTRSAKHESLANGYRSSSRRAYRELCARQRLMGSSAVSDRHIDEVLQQHDNFCIPARVHRL